MKVKHRIHTFRKLHKYLKGYKMKFEVGEIWQTREKFTVMIQSIDNSNYPITYLIISHYPNATIQVNAEGFEIGTGYLSELDLVKYLGPKEKFPEYFL